ncbi:heme/copper-type cytochrome/quinol oxidase subunit 2 [Lysobacter niastensis]|uniref:Heme/copper-type cytochrome/quinol oxidase subunit 2 n=1 Tax=Lysobacter niastensis TaxID=380629 RepID=A0ABU1W840_9GAMM|nr:heme/copper-type cytochrome/quinol oxidase subunit 2 [Lysobacter niastensis]
MAHVVYRASRNDRRAERIRQGARRFLVVWLTVAALALMAHAIAPAGTGHSSHDARQAEARK